MVTTRSGTAIAPSADVPSGLPKWLDDMLKPGVSSGVFTTLKISLVGLLFTLCAMLYMIEDERVQFHLKIFLSMSVVLLILVLWFVGELAKSKALEGKRGKKKD